MAEEQEKFDSMDEFQNRYIKNPKVGESIEFVVRGFKKLSLEECKFTYQDEGGVQKTATTALSSVDYGIAIHTAQGQIYNVTSWSVWGQIKAIFKKLGTKTGEGVRLQIHHAADGLLKENRDKAWIVRAYIDGKWKSLNKATRKWDGAKR